MRIRQISGDERTTKMFPLQAYAWLPSPATSDEDEVKHRANAPFFETTTMLVAEADGVAMACAAALPMRQNVRGLVLEMAGISAVTSDPEARRRGVVRQLMERLLRQAREEGAAVSALYPFRPSFYAKFGYVGIPRVRVARFAPAGLGDLLHHELPGSVRRLPGKEAFDEYDALVHRLLPERHGFAVFDAARTGVLRDEPVWIALARVGDEVVGGLRYRIEQHGGDLKASNLFSTGPLGRALLLQFLARHVDQVATIELLVGADELPELWGTDLAMTVTGTVANPVRNAPMVRVLDVPALAGSAAGSGSVTVEIAGDELIGGVWQLGADDGRLTVKPGGTPSVTLTAAGFSALAYGVLDATEVFTRGLGELEPRLDDLFPRLMPYMFADF
ncbi:GNAT family N-acetyltransferase [Actinoplanes oblitus]|uniref:GNAT family N-acetyltransferase n=1 Tax=Actinoplanes oblitus TaxID=3040509 RepID=A0ABY8WBE6_9ACTN|nr:GNAT family N-acetyltransferase [Actinoplanes oblitus]WIM95201.1 GNAT family N-acetyltransferase [Actinoplanes oblitus]